MGKGVSDPFNHIQVVLKQQEGERFDEVGKKIKGEKDMLLQTEGGRRYIQLGPPGTLNSITPCAACKLLRRSNISKMLMEVLESHRADAVNSLIYEANVRLGDPAYGCMGAISALQLLTELEEGNICDIILRFVNRINFVSLEPFHCLIIGIMDWGRIEKLGFENWGFLNLGFANGSSRVSGAPVNGGSVVVSRKWRPQGGGRRWWQLTGLAAIEGWLPRLRAQINAVRAEILKYKFSQANHHHHHHHHVAIDMNNTTTTTIIPGSCPHHLTFLTSGTVLIAMPPPEPLNAVEPPTPPPPQAPHSLVSSSMCTQPSGSDFSYTSNENISYFG
ncbi:LOW QUALITY PROTEIN: hypothetical protein Cgig2_002593 [Carnegiea gigantea]|uniref:LOB domain-containing protein n=1 Tax=Carnegiea gigantea TaxID=171969 RepID=A0A9Q1JLB2_9CARY|nr:LOW QUALITY PROTEIN: hypothetical protein Cgig2_002593 [Carnegiea gigantea]